MESVDPMDTRYIVFKRSEFFTMLGYLMDPDTPPKGPEVALDEVEKLYLHDAVVIRRQDYLAAPALATYASVIGLATHLTSGDVKDRLLAVADYFQQQSELAAEEGWKLPD
jgi:hypothetical protein